MDIVNVQELMEESNRLRMELTDLEEQMNQRESEISNLNADLGELRMKIKEKSMTLKDCQERLANIDDKKIREQIEEKRRD